MFPHTLRLMPQLLDYCVWMGENCKKHAAESSSSINTSTTCKLVFSVLEFVADLHLCYLSFVSPPLRSSGSEPPSVHQWRWILSFQGTLFHQFSWGHWRDDLTELWDRVGMSAVPGVVAWSKNRVLSCSLIIMWLHRFIMFSTGGVQTPSLGTSSLEY